jgi:single-strand DNA-binding protein
MSINRVILLGNVGRDPEIRSLQSGDKVANFSIATSESWKDKTTGQRKEVTEWHTIAVFNQNIIKIVEQYVEKGSRVAVEGKIKTRKWQDKEGNDRYTTEIVIDKFDGRLSLEGKPGGGGAARDDGSNGTSKNRGGDGDIDDEIPF